MHCINKGMQRNLLAAICSTADEANIATPYWPQPVLGPPNMGGLGACELHAGGVGASAG